MGIRLVGSLRNIFLQGIERGDEIHFINRLIRLLQQRCERVFLFAGSGACGWLCRRLALGLRN